MKKILAASFALALIFNYINANAQIASIHNPCGSERRTASGQMWNSNELVAAHKTYRLGSYIKIRDCNTGKEVICKIIDRGPYVSHRCVDISTLAAKKLGLSSKKGILKVTILLCKK